MGRRSGTDLHGLDGFVGLFDGIYLEPFGGVGEHELVDDLNLVIGRSDGNHRRHYSALYEGKRENENEEIKRDGKLSE